MAFGTPVVGTTAYSAAAGTTVAPSYPASIVATDQLVMVLGMKPSTANSGSVTTPTGWTLRESLTAAGGYGTTLGADTGNTNIYIYTKDVVTAGLSGTVTVTVATNNVCWANITRVPTGGGTILYGSADGQRTTTPTSPLSVGLTNGATATAFQAGDFAIWAMCIPTDVTTPAQFSAHTLTSSGVTFNATAELIEPDSGNGTDIGGYVAYVTVATGTGGGAPTVGATLAGTLTNVRGPIALLRMRELRALTLDAQPGSFAVTGQDNNFLRTYSFNAEAGSLAITGQDADLAVGSALQNYEINAEAGSLSLSGQSATVIRALAVNAQSGSAALAGQAATLLRSRTLNAEAGSYSLSGQAATLQAAKSLNAQAGLVSLSGQDAQLVYNAADPVLDASAGSLALSGQAVGFEWDRVLNAEAGQIVLTGQDATLQITTSSYVLDAQPGSISLTGADATVRRAALMNAQVGRYGISPWADPQYADPQYASGLDATFLYGRVMVAGSGSYAVTGVAAEFQVVTAYPDPRYVQEGIQYGPGGIYTGTLKPGGGSYMRRR